MTRPIYGLGRPSGLTVREETVRIAEDTLRMMEARNDPNAARWREAVAILKARAAETPKRP